MPDPRNLWSVSSWLSRLLQLAPITATVSAHVVLCVWRIPTVQKFSKILPQFLQFCMQNWETVEMIFQPFGIFLLLTIFDLLFSRRQIFRRGYLHVGDRTLLLASKVLFAWVEINNTVEEQKTNMRCRALRNDDRFYFFKWRPRKGY